MTKQIAGGAPVPSNTTIRGLEQCAAEVRLQIVKAMGPNKFHHFGGALSAADLVVALYHYKLRLRPDQPDWP